MITFEKTKRAFQSKRKQGQVNTSQVPRPLATMSEPVEDGPLGKHPCFVLLFWVVVVE
jgi:hypothetical protein